MAGLTKPRLVVRGSWGVAAAPPAAQRLPSGFLQLVQEEEEKEEGCGGARLPSRGLAGRASSFIFSTVCFSTAC